MAPLPANFQQINTMTLIDMLIASAAEKSLLQFSDAPLEELTNVQSKIDSIQSELFRRCSW